MRVVLAGGSGFLGGALASRLAGAGHDVSILGRRRSLDPPASRIHHIVWTPDGSTGRWASAIDEADAVVNLAGAGIADKRWDAARKRDLVNSRLRSTASLVAAIDEAQVRPGVFVQNCAVGYYGFGRGADPIDERDAPGDDFLARLCVDWEAAAAPVTRIGCRLVILRTGVVLAKSGGALPQMMMPFRFFVGGPMGSGRQYISWIHLDDWINLMIWAIATPAVIGPVNATAPSPVTNAELAHAIGAAMHRPSLIPAPGFVLRVVVGEMANAALLGSQRVLPRRAQELGFTFAHPEIGGAMTSLLR